MLIHHFLENSASATPDKTALICGKQRLSYGEINEKANNVAAALIEMGIQRTDRVVLFLDNSAEAIIALFAVMKAGAIFILPSPALKAGKLNHILIDSGAKLLITHPSKVKVVKKALGDASPIDIIVWCQRPNHKISQKLDALAHPPVETSWSSLVECSVPINGRFFPRQIDLDLATIIYTSSPSGKPRGVMWAHANVVAAVDNINHYFGNTADEIVLTALPLAFDYGLYQVFIAFCAGATLVLERSFIYPYQVIEKIDTFQATAFPIVPTMAAILLEMEDLSDFSFSSLKYISNATGTLSATSVKKLRDLFPHVHIYSMYGLPECQRVSYLPPQEISYKPDSVGFPMPNVEARILDPAGKPVAPHQTGELVVRGLNVMQGYWNAPELTEQRFSRDPVSNTRSWLHTGDLFRKDEDGYLYFAGHMDDTVTVKGERISPREIETTLGDFPGVQETAVIAIPDKFGVKALKAFVVATETQALDEKQLLRFCADRLEPVLLPKYIELRDQLPKLEDGSIDRKSLGRQGKDRRRKRDRRQMTQITMDDGTTTFIERRVNSDRRSGQDRRRRPVTT
jgi:amino acid adenylation domain-containing protein